MECKYGYNDCISPPEDCLFCSNGLKYKEPKKKYSFKKKQQRPDKRKGSAFEYANHERNKSVLSSKMTLNSGATNKEKGDENLVIGSIKVMEELKTQEAKRGKGCKTFTIKREWLNKLHTEALQRNFDFWYLKFAFNEDEAAGMKAEKFSEGNPAGNVFIVVEQDVIMAMVQRLAQDEIKAASIDDKLDFYKKKWLAEEAGNVHLKAENEMLKAKIKLLTENHKVNEITNELKKIV